MQLMDDALFNLWRDKKVEKEEIFFKAQNPDDLRSRVANAERGVFDDEKDVRDDMDDDKPKGK